MTAGEMIKVLQTGIRRGHYSRDDELTIATSTNRLNMDGQIGIDSVAASITSGRGKYLPGPIIEVKGRVRCV